MQHDTIDIHLLSSQCMASSNRGDEFLSRAMPTDMSLTVRKTILLVRRLFLFAVE